MDIANLDDAEAFTTLDGSCIRDVAGRVALPARRRSPAEATVPPYSHEDTVLTEEPERGAA